MRLQEEFAMLPLKNKPSTSAPFGGCSRPVTRLISSSGPRAGRSSAGATASPCATTSTRAPSSSSCSTRTRFARPASAASSRSTASKFFHNIKCWFLIRNIIDSFFSLIDFVYLCCRKLNHHFYNEYRLHLQI